MLNVLFQPSVVTEEDHRLDYDALSFFTEVGMTAEGKSFIR